MYISTKTNAKDETMAYPQQLHVHDEVVYDGQEWQIFGIHDAGDDVYEFKLGQIPGRHACLSERFESAYVDWNDNQTIQAA